MSAQVFRTGQPNVPITVPVPDWAPPVRGTTDRNGVFVAPEFAGFTATHGDAVTGPGWTTADRDPGRRGVWGASPATLATVLVSPTIDTATASDPGVEVHATARGTFTLTASWSDDPADGATTVTVANLPTRPRSDGALVVDASLRPAGRYVRFALTPTGTVTDVAVFVARNN